MMSMTLSRRWRRCPGTAGGVLRRVAAVLTAALCAAGGAVAGAESWRLEEVAVPPAGAEAWERAWRAAAGDLGPAATLVDEASRYIVLSRAADVALPPAANTGTGDATASALGPEEMRSWLLTPEPALSRQGSSPIPSDPPFVHYRLLFVEPDRVAEATAALAGLESLLDRLEQPAAHRVYRAVAGPDRPLLVVVSAAESAAAWYARRAELDAALGPEGRAIEQRLRRVLRRIEPRQGQPRPGLSHGDAEDRLWARFAGLGAPALAVPAEPLPPRAAPTVASPAEPSVPSPATDPIVVAARLWIERSPTYDPAYRVLDFPGGDPGPGVGTGVDLVVRALRAVGIDLQQAIHDDLGADPGAYGQAAGGRDTNIDHRRIRNLRIWLDRHAERLDTEASADWRPGDLVLWDTVGDGKADHVGILSDRRTAAGLPFVIHHFPARAPFTGTPREESVFDLWPRLAHFRIRSPETRPPSP